MIAVISETVHSEDFPDCLVAPKFYDILERVQRTNLPIDTLVFSDYGDDTTKLVGLLTGYCERHSVRIFYIRNAQDHNPSVRVTINGLGGQYCDDEFYVSNQQALRSLMDSNEVDLVQPVMSDIKILEGFLSSLQNGEAMTPARVQLVQSASDHIVQAFQDSHDSILAQSSAAVEIFNQAFSAQREFRKMLAEAQAKLEEYKVKNPRAAVERPTAISQVYYYPRVSYNGGKRVYKIKQIGGMKFLTSFSMGFSDYLKNHKHYKPRLVFLENKGEVPQNRYRDYPWITGSTSLTDGVFKSPIIFTNHPSSKVISKLLDDSLYDTVLIVDRMDSQMNHLIDSVSKVIYAVEGNSVVEELGLPANRCITSCTTMDNFLATVNLFQSYPKQTSARVSNYAQLTGKYKAMLKEIESR